jgi:hypothetical protein
MPARMLFSADAGYLFVNTAGFNERGVSVVDLSNNSVVRYIDLFKSWIGLSLTIVPCRRQGRRSVA